MLPGTTENHRCWHPVAYFSRQVYLLTKDEEKATDELQKKIFFFFFFKREGLDQRQKEQ